MPALVHFFQWFYPLYFVALNAGYLALNIVALFALNRLVESRAAQGLPPVYSSFGLPISIIVPAHDEAVTIGDSLHALLQLEYPQYEIIVVNDGSTDATLEVLEKEFALQPFPEAYRVRVPVQPIRRIYRSSAHPKLRVIDKDNGGKADALNAGLNAARYPIFCGIDADSILARDSLDKVVQPFLEDPTTIAAGGTIRIANGCRVDQGFIERVGLPRSRLATIQIVEYLRAFLFGRLGWSPLNALLIISGAFGLFRKEAVIAAGGYRTDTVGEDMELVARLHRRARLAQQPYRITFVPDPICWTEAPEDWSTLCRQRMRWQRGLAESLSANYALCFNRHGGTAGWLAFPFLLAFELLGPFIEVSGFVFFLTAAACGWVSYQAFAIFLSLAIGLGIFLSVGALLLEELSFHVYPRIGQTLKLLLAAVVENLGYRQLLSVWRFIGLMQWAFGTKGRWGTMRRRGTWNETAR